MRLRYTQKAREDLRAIKQYIAVDLCNPSAAESVTQRIVYSCCFLKEQPYIGRKLSEKTNRNTDLKYIISGNYLIFYRIEDINISVVRILDSRTDYLQDIHLF